MNPLLLVSSVASIVLLILIASEIVALVARKRKRRRGSIRRAPLLEARMRSALAGPREYHGDWFATHVIWRERGTTRMDITTAKPWQSISDFSRSLIVRHIWRALRTLVSGTVLVRVDPGTPDSMIWSAAETARFDDCGVIPRWVRTPITRTGTMVSWR